MKTLVTTAALIFAATRERVSKPNPEQSARPCNEDRYLQRLRTHLKHDV